MNEEREFKPIRTVFPVEDIVEVRPMTARRQMIVCKPIPGRDGIEYVPEWYGLTNFG